VSLFASAFSRRWRWRWRRGRWRRSRKRWRRGQRLFLGRRRDTVSVVTRAAVGTASARALWRGRFSDTEQHRRLLDGSLLGGLWAWQCNRQTRRRWRWRSRSRRRSDDDDVGFWRRRR
jgi:hypothetical protein